MLLLFVIILLVVGLAIIGALYSLFSPFFQQLGDIKQYNMAYYGAVSSVERGMLALRYQGPGYEATSGWQEYNEDMDRDDSDAATGDFGLLRDGDMYRHISSTTQQIPRPGDSNVPYALRGGGSEEYLTLGYNELMEFALDIAPSNTFYTGSDTVATRSEGLSEVSLYAKLPQRVYSGYGGDPNANLAASCTNGQCDRDNDGIENDLVIDRSLEGSYINQFFRIVPRVDVNYISGAVRQSDTLIRESHINKTTDDGDYTATWGGSHHENPLIIDSGLGVNRPSQNIIGPSGVVSDLVSESFALLYKNTDISHMKLLLGLARILQLPDGKLYPFLETKITANKPIPDLYYRLEGVGRVGSYDVVIRVKKPTSNRNLFGSFTIVF